MTRDPHLETSLLAAYMDGEVTASERSAIERSLAGSAEARDRLATLERIRDALARPTPELDEIDLVDGVRRAIVRPPSAKSTRRSGWFLLAAAVTAGVAALAPFLVRSEDSEFRAKSGSEVRERWAGIRVFSVSGGAAPTSIGNEVRAADGLIFSYTNLGPQPFSHLMIFAVDSDRAVHWYHPAYETAATDPSSISLEPGVASQPLPELIQHDFAPGQLRIYALFSRHAFRVSEIERWVALEQGRPVAAPDAGSYLAEIKTRVAR